METIFDTFNAKAAIFALETLFEERGRRWPVMISGTITDASRRTLSGQVTEASGTPCVTPGPLLIGLNSRSAPRRWAYLAELARIADCFVSCYPNAGLPNAFGEYDEAAEQTADIVKEFAQSGLVNLLGGCSGTSPGPRPRDGPRHRRPPAASAADDRNRLPLSRGSRPLTITEESRCS